MGNLLLSYESARSRATQLDFAGADRILTERVPHAERTTEMAAFALWVKANLQSELDPLVVLLDGLVEDDPKSEHALYYRGLVLKRAGQTKAALRDFVTLAKQNPSHAGALSEIKELRRLGNLT